MTIIVSTHSYRGGTGKSNTTANIAAQLARRGRSVAIVDTDIQSPGIHVLFGIEPDRLRYTLNDYLWGRCRIEEAAHDVTDRLAEAVAGATGGTVMLVPSSIRPGEIARVVKEGYDVNLLNDGFQDLSRALALDYLLIDTHPGVNEETLLSIAISDTLLLVLRPDHQDYQGTAVTLDLARRLGVPQLLLIVNKVLPSLDFRELSDRIASTYRVPVAAVLPLSEDMVRLGSGGLYSLLAPTSAYADGIAAITALVDSDR
ncbi:CDP-3,6-dideoxy-D-glycero-L-glycero-4-hexulose-4-reductase [Bosea sp. Tri-44]|uniref:MinD/ParA family ATP-binding protein n=1 Tax=Bosea sp. Tri-44 TaxID=1972137 RepID=UPI00100EC7D3|nr:MinD/ParA family protein [Bosea sp. Tri-44]RXT52546.1 CDP-3,6-dideoxy-D-glycero-L-glycero-4-hexulose-4-reductase [Bosea sp. Tri-44]